MPKTLAEIAQIASDTVARTQKVIAEQENQQRKRGTPFTSHELKDYEAFVETGIKQVKKVNQLLEEEQ